MKTYVHLFIIILLTSVSCHSPLPPAKRVIAIQPFTDLPVLQATLIYKQLKKTHPNLVLRKAIPLPKSAYYQQSNRYRADVIINYLDHFGSTDTVIIGLTSKDISITKGNILDWGVMGLGFTPGNACVISTFRLSKTKINRQFYKVALHELGHTAGLQHCPNPTCFMRDARAGNHLDAETGFCTSCKSFLKGKGWLL